MYSLEERTKAVQCLIKNDFCFALTLCELGYPKSRCSLSTWYKEYTTTGLSAKRKPRKRKYTSEQRTVAVHFFIEHGRSYNYTVHQLGYPSRPLLKQWVEEDAPSIASAYCRKGSPLVYLSQEQKRQAVTELCAGYGTAQEIADRYGVSKCSLYNWRRQLLNQGITEIMPDKNVSKKSEFINQGNIPKEVSEPSSDFEQLQQENAILRKENQELEKLNHRLRLENDVLEKAAEVLKKGRGVNLKTLKNNEKAIVIDALRDRYSLKELLSVLSMARSSYYYQEAQLHVPDKYNELRQTIRKDFSESGCCYGYRRIHSGLRNRGIIISEKVVRRIMREENLSVPFKKRRKYSSYKGEITPAAPNILKRDFHADKPNEKWLTDITEFHIPAGKIYLSPMIDCFDGLPVSWAIGTRPDAELVNAMLDMAVKTLSPNEHPIVHTDRGCHYRWPGWINRMKQAGLIRSMSKKGCSPDNAACEGFFGRLKNEMFYGHDWRGVSIQEFIDRLDAYMYWYAEKRIKISLGGLSPVAFRRKQGLVA